MFARPLCTAPRTDGGDDTLAGMAHAMGCATLVDAPRTPAPASACLPVDGSARPHGAGQPDRGVRR